jgi:hypothetical protein
LSLLKKHSRPAAPEVHRAVAPVGRPPACQSPALARRALRALLPLAAVAALSGDVGAVRPAATGRPGGSVTSISCAPTARLAGDRRPAWEPHAGTLPLRSARRAASPQVACAAGGLSRPLCAATAWRASATAPGADPEGVGRRPGVGGPSARLRSSRTGAETSPERPARPYRRDRDATRRALLVPTVRHKSNGYPATGGHVHRCGETNGTRRRAVNVLWGE